MRYKTIVSLLLLFPFFAMAQSFSSWNLYVNKTKLLSSSIDSIASVQLPAESKGTLKISFSQRDTSFKRSVILMNEQRQTLLEKQMKPTCKTASFSINDLILKSNRKPFIIYIVDIPSDPAKAMLVRVAPAAICKVSWQ